MMNEKPILYVRIPQDIKAEVMNLASIYDISMSDMVLYAIVYSLFLRRDDFFFSLSEILNYLAKHKEKGGITHE